MSKGSFVMVGLAALASVFLFSAASSDSDQVVLTKSNQVTMFEEFSDESVGRVMLAITDLDRKLPKSKPIYLVLNSPGSSIESGLLLIDGLNALKRQIHTVSLFSASMAFHTAQALKGDRLLTNSGIYMSHKAKGGFQGEFPGQLDTRYQFFLRRLAILDENIVKRSNGKLTKESYTQMYENEYWCQGQDCVDKGFADRVAQVVCDDTLGGTVTQKVKVSFLGIAMDLVVSKAACPLIPGVQQAEAKVGTKKADINSISELVRIPEIANLPPESIIELQKFLKDKVLIYNSTARLNGKAAK